jgi:virginiamycin B lyase
MMAMKLQAARARRYALALFLSACLLGGLGALALLRGTLSPLFVEYRMQEPLDMPIAIAAAADGTVWFTMDRADAIGRIRGGVLERVPTSGPNAEPTGLGIAQDGSAWFTDIRGRGVARVSPSGEVARFPLDSPIVRLGRLAVAPEGSAWVAEVTRSSITRLKEGKVTRHEVDVDRGGPYGVAVSSDGSVWATLQSANQLLRITPDGIIQSFDIPRPGALPTDVATGEDGSVWFLEFRGNRIGRWQGGKFNEYEITDENVGLSGLAVAPDGAVWFGMVRGSSLGRLRAGKVKTFKLPRENARPYTVAVDPGGNVWYADITGYVGMLPARHARD